jgi:hypothetical protein
MNVRNSLLAAVSISIAAAVLVSRTHVLVSQDAQFGMIQGIVTREGTTEPLPDVHITVLARGSLAATGFTAQQVLQAFNRGAAVDLALVQMAQDATGGGPKAAIANAAPLKAISDSAGRFTVRSVPAGEHELRAQLQNYFGPAIGGSRASGVSQTVVVTARETTEVQISLIKGGTISGRVLDATGKPLQNASVQALQWGYENDLPSLQVEEMKPTDDRGEYRLGVLAPGDYYVAVTPASAGARGAPAPVIAPAAEIAITTLYPSASDESKALSVAVRAGEDQPGMNIQLRSVPASKILGRVTHTLPAAPPPAPRGGIRPMIAVVGLAPRDRPTLPDVSGTVIGINAAADGTFEIPNVPPGSYYLYARLPIAQGWGGLAPPERATTPLALGRTSIEVRGGSVEGITVAVGPGVDVKGRVVLDGQPPAENSIQLSLLPDDGAPRVNETQISNVIRQVAQYVPKIGEDGTFTFPLMPEGHYRLQVTFNGLAKNSYVADIRQGPTSIFDNGFTVGREANPIEISASTNGGIIEGTLFTADHKPVSTPTPVILVPVASRRQNFELYKFTNTDAKGDFAFNGVAPGTWKVFAWELVQAGAYQNPEFMQQYETRGTNVTVTAGMRSNANVTLIRD